jgi:hypothetical protein
MQENVQGKVFLLVTSILMIVGGAFGLFSSIALIGVSLLFGGLLFWQQFLRFWVLFYSLLPEFLEQ